MRWVVVVVLLLARPVLATYTWHVEDVTSGGYTWADTNTHSVLNITTTRSIAAGHSVVGWLVQQSGTSKVQGGTTGIECADSNSNVYVNSYIDTKNSPSGQPRVEACYTLNMSATWASSTFTLTYAPNTAPVLARIYDVWATDDTTGLPRTLGIEEAQYSNSQPNGPTLDSGSSAHFRNGVLAVGGGAWNSGTVTFTAWTPVSGVITDLADGAQSGSGTNTTKRNWRGGIQNSCPGAINTELKGSLSGSALSTTALINFYDTVDSTCPAPTATPTVTPTVTNTPVLTYTPTATPTPTPTPTPTLTPTICCCHYPADNSAGWSNPGCTSCPTPGGTPMGGQCQNGAVPCT